MSLEEKDIELIEKRLEQHIRKHLGTWLSEMSYAHPPQVYEIELRERMIRVEEELKNQRDLILQFMQQVDKRFEQVDKRFEEMRTDMDKRFEQVDKRFEEMRTDMDKRFEQVDKRFEEMRIDMNKRFEQMNLRIDRFMRWSFATTLTVGGMIVAAIKLLP